MTENQDHNLVGFAFEYRVQGMHFRSTESIRIGVNSPTDVNFVFSRTGIRGNEAMKGEFLLTALTRRKPHHHTVAFLETLQTEHKMPERPTFSFVVDARGKVRGQHRRETTGAPEKFEVFITGLQHEMYDSARKILSLIRWRVDAAGPHQPIANPCHAFFTWDGNEYYQLPLPGNTLFEFQRDVCVTQEQKAEIKSFFENGVDEPSAHSIFREAWAARLSSPRSALILGVAALEIGVKECFAELVPDAEWLVMNVPSPSVVKMLEQGLPKLPVRLKIAGKVLPPPVEVIKLLTKAVKLRNDVAHAGKGEVRRDDVQDLLAAIRDTISLLDYYCGHEWALCHISDSTIRQIEGVDVAELQNKIKVENQLHPPTASGVFMGSDLPLRLD